MNRAVRAVLAFAAVVGVGGATAAPATASADPQECRGGYLCLYSGIGYTGHLWMKSRCGFYNIGLEGWSDRVRSYRNLQSTGTVSIFMQWDGATWVELGRSTASEEVYDATSIYATDGVWVC
ncbi:peptidase inhibitor family I36 protein [Saccharothrix texasensis]|uniref:Peptidase inhibitor family I36 n=1 Tax=Saccharothrix texasensis TaxID=103734 RepID=A0A3N1H5M7_9PSEU|nr:peptidase inhibitor family I36 protein [Saccharothrix texasensis]ROP37512.1 peptidase inhibitor family I36 [Saccharothrix texasensis]